MSRFKTLLLLGGIIVFLLGETACSCLKHYKDTEYNYRDSIIYKTEVVYRDSVVYDRIVDSVSVIVTRDTASRLETDVAISQVEVSGGTMSHILKNKPQLRPIEVKFPETTITSERVQYITQKEIVEVEKKLTFRDRLEDYLIGAFFAFVLCWIVVLIWFVRK